MESDIGQSMSRYNQRLDSDSKQKRAVVRLRSRGLRFITGVSSSYDDEFPVELEEIAEQYAVQELNRQNYTPYYHERGVEWRLVKSWGRSWIEISYPQT